MARATTCRLQGRIIEVSVALRLRDDARRKHGAYPEFRCCECDEYVTPLAESSIFVAHFEHRRGTIHKP
jgi:hypothetical protein